MLAWLRNRPAKVRQAARPAVKDPKTEDREPRTEDRSWESGVSEQESRITDQESKVRDRRSGGNAQELDAAISTEFGADVLPPPFFADDDPAFLDLTEPNQRDITLPPLPQISFSLSSQHSPQSTADTTLVSALKSLPPWPRIDEPNRTEQLLEILRRLDRIAGDVCTALESDREVRNPLLLPRKSR